MCYLTFANEQEKKQEHVLSSLRTHNMRLTCIIYTIQYDRKHRIYYASVCHLKFYNKEKASIRYSKYNYLLKYLYLIFLILKIKYIL